MVNFFKRSVRGPKYNKVRVAWETRKESDSFLNDIPSGTLHRPLVSKSVLPNFTLFRMLSFLRFTYTISTTTLYLIHSWHDELNMQSKKKKIKKRQLKNFMIPTCPTFLYHCLNFFCNSMPLSVYVWETLVLNSMQIECSRLLPC